MREGESREFGACGKRYQEKKKLTIGTAELRKVRGTHVARAHGQHRCSRKHNLIGRQEAWGVAVWKGSWEGTGPSREMQLVSEVQHLSCILPVFPADAFSYVYVYVYMFGKM